MEDEGERINGMASASTRTGCNELWWQVAVAVIGGGITERVGFGYSFQTYKLAKNLLKLTTKELPLLEPVLLLLVRLGEEVVDNRTARSSYLAWDSRGSWPKRPKAHGAAVEVGNREKEGAILEDEDDI